MREGRPAGNLTQEEWNMESAEQLEARFRAVKKIVKILETLTGEERKTVIEMVMRSITGDGGALPH